MAPSALSQSQSMPFTSSYSINPRHHIRQNTPSATHCWKRSCAVELGQMPVALSAFHWQPVRSTKKIPFMHTRSGLRGRPPPKRCVFLCAGSSGSMRAQSSSDTSDLDAILAMHEPPCSRLSRQISSRQNQGYSDRF